ncbi:hypothetical protein [Rhodanobacter sp. OK091]|uniref:hypothetical protein n=1 Tax=Rhodanobacter sp. OK091 TaxID=1881037 RepID=UPI0011602D76|nr:hypothetical protein [Rhodanobacter sp. OK091]
MPGSNGLALDRWMKRHRKTADPGVLATLAMQSIGGRWGQTIHGCILIRSGQMTDGTAASGTRIKTAFCTAGSYAWLTARPQALDGLLLQQE